LHGMDELIEKVGEFGKFQYKVIVIVGLVSALSSACIYATIFIAAEPDFMCGAQGESEIKFENEILLKNSTTTASSDDYDADESCRIWISLRNSTAEEAESRCRFDETFYGRTIITEWKLICDQHYWASVTQTLHMFGSIFGFYGGVFGDRYGRRRSVLIFSFLLTATLLVTQLFLSVRYFDLSIRLKYAIYSLSQFLIGLLVNCVYCTAYVLLMEFTTEKYRTKISK
jgi:hypothetical protein